MILEFILYIFYAVILGFLLLQIPVVKSSELSIRLIVTLYVIKLIGGLMDMYIAHIRFYGGDGHYLYLDTLNYISNLNINNKHFYEYFFTGWTRFHLDEGIFSRHNRVALSDLGCQLNYRFMTLSNLLSFGKEYVNSIFYCFVFIIGQFALYKTFYKLYPNKKYTLLVAVFLIPSVWFWCSGVHKDGFVMSFIGLMIYYIYKFSITKSKRYFILFFLFLALATIIRFYILIALAPALLLFYTSSYFKKYTWVVFSFGILLYGFLFFNINKIIPNLNPAEMVVIKQQEFYSLKGKSIIEREKLEPNISSFAQDFIPSLKSVMLRPYFSEIKDSMYLLGAIETKIILFFMAFLFFSGIKRLNNSLVLSSIFFCTVMLLITGYVVPFSGAFIRYRSEYFPILFCALIAIGNTSKIERLLEKIFSKLNLAISSKIKVN